jgi:hypothetical protein
VATVPIDYPLFIGLPISLVYFENKLYISDFFGDTLITEFDIDKKTVTSKIITKGEGPGEAQSPLMISVAKNSLLMFNKKSFRLGYYPLKDSIDTRKQLNFSCQITSEVSNLTSIGKNRYLASGFFENGRYAILNAEGKVEKEFGNYPAFLTGEKDRPNQAKAMFHQVRFETNMNINKVVCISSHILEIVDFSKSVVVVESIKLGSYDYKFTTGDVISSNKTSDTSRGAIAVTSTDNFIYLIFNDSKLNDSKLKNDIWVFDWNGEPVKKLNVDKNIILITAVNDNLIYALTDGEYGIVKLNIK